MTKPSPMTAKEYSRAISIVRSRRSVLSYTVRFGLGYHEVIAYVDRKRKTVVKKLRSLRAKVILVDSVNPG